MARNKGGRHGLCLVSTDTTELRVSIAFTKDIYGLPNQLDRIEPGERLTTN
jgi:hypothetical protein